MLFLVALFFWFNLGSVFSFPLKTCNSDTKEILFVLDCRHEIKEQLDFLNQTVDYLHNNRNWTALNVSYLTSALREPVGVEILTSSIPEKASEMSDQCNGTIPLDDLFHVTKRNEKRKHSHLKISFIFLKVDNIIHDAIIDRQDKDVDSGRFFIFHYNSSEKDSKASGERSKKSISKLLTRPSSYMRIGGKGVIVKSNIHYTVSFKNLEIMNLFPKICDIKCTSTELSFESQNFQVSYYHVNFTSISHNEGVEYCDKHYNSYLISIETYEELDHLLHDVLKIKVPSVNDTESLRLHLGLVLRLWMPIYWSSENPFTYYHELTYHENPQCVYMNYTIRDNDTVSFKDSKRIWKYLNVIDCDKILNGAYLVCECHRQLHQEIDFVIKPLNKPDTFGLASKDDLLFLGFKYFDEMKTLHQLNCSNSSYFFHEENYFCKAAQLTTPVHNFVHETYLKESHDQQCSTHCLPYYTIHSQININMNDTPLESYCFTNKCPPKKVEKPRQIPVSVCKTNKEVVLKCLHSYLEGCMDNSHLENCENFNCPDEYVKCPGSYCIPLAKVNNARRLCPLGQEKTMFSKNKFMCTSEVTMKFKDICINSYVIELYSEFYGIPNFSICDAKCPPEYGCWSHNSRDKLIPFLILNLELYNVSNSFFPSGESVFYLPILQVVEMNVSGCKITNVDQSFQHWNTEEIAVLDLSRNKIKGSDDLKSVAAMTRLLYLNVSGNFHLTINNFTFPTMLEVIDLSYTSVASLPKNSLEKLSSLRILKLEYSKIKCFEKMGLPHYFRLGILNLEGLRLTGIRADYFNGLTVYKELRSSDFELCCQQILGLNISSSKCHAPNDAITTCQNIVGDKVKRILVWVVGLMTIAGNGVVLIYRVGWSKKKIYQTAYGLFVTGLAVADLLMGVYLMIIAAVDVIYADVYVLYDASWRNSKLCHFSGFLSTLSSETSTFLIGLITLDRFFIVSDPFNGLGTSERLKWKGFILSWVTGFTLALIPVVVPEWQIYSSNGLCLALPLSTTGSDKLPGWEFSMSVYIILNFVLFLFIALGQIGIFMNVIKKGNLPSLRHCSERRTQDMNMAKKLAFVALSDFLCWFPIGIMGILSLAGQEFDKETYAWMAVFVLPVNSALNPMIYTFPVILDRLRHNIEN